MVVNDPGQNSGKGIAPTPIASKKGSLPTTGDGVIVAAVIAVALAVFIVIAITKKRKAEVEDNASLGAHANERGVSRK